MEKLIYKLNKTNVFIKLFFLAFVLYLAIDSLFPSGTGLTSMTTWIRAIVMVIVLFIFIGFYIPELAIYKNKKRDLE